MGGSAVFLTIGLWMLEEFYVQNELLNDFVSIIAGNLGCWGFFLIFVLKLKQIYFEIQKEKEEKESLLNSECSVENENVKVKSENKCILWNLAKK